MSPLRNKTPNRSRLRNDQSMALARRRRSLRLQHSMSLHIPMEELNGISNYTNSYIDLGVQKFSLTYLGQNNTHNPDSLQVLEGLRMKNWQAYFVSTLYNFNYTQNQIGSLRRAVKNTLIKEFQISFGDKNLNTEVIIVDYLNPTENDNQALKITAIAVDDQEKETLLYEGYMISWCNTEKSDDVLLPLLICYGKKKYQTLVHTVLCEKLNIRIQRIALNQEEFLHLSTYCLIMLDENDNFPAKMTFETFSGIIRIEKSVESCLKLWKKIHKDGNIEVDLDEVLLFNEAFEKFMECSIGMTMGCTLLQSVSVKGCYSLTRSGQMKSFSTKTIHVVLKYLNFLAVQRLRIRDPPISHGVNGSSSELPSVQS